MPAQGPFGTVSTPSPQVAESVSNAAARRSYRAPPTDKVHKRDETRWARSLLAPTPIDAPLESPAPHQQGTVCQMRPLSLR